MMAVRVRRVVSESLPRAARRLAWTTLWAHKRLPGAPAAPSCPPLPATPPQPSTWSTGRLLASVSLPSQAPRFFSSVRSLVMVFSLPLPSITCGMGGGGGRWEEGWHADVVQHA